MTTQAVSRTMLIPTIHSNFAHAAETKTLFSFNEKLQLNQLEKREQPEFGKPGESCKINLFFGFFFDGTKNNYLDAETGKNHSNVARLYDCYPGMSVPGVLNKAMDWQYKPAQYGNFFRVYIPGVSSTFSAVEDSGKGWHEKAGGASGAFGERRIIWAMIQAINNVHRFFLKAALVSPAESLKLVKKIVLDKYRRDAFRPRGFLEREIDEDDDILETQKALQGLLERLHGAIKDFIPDPKTGKPRTIGPGMVKTIHMSTFGFSRGATQARAFQNWMLTMCRFDAKLRRSSHQMTLGGFPVIFDFLGLFDTVASVGAGNSLGNVPVLSYFDGHGSWADAESSLRVAHGIPCVHLVAAHELRRSFPLDSISVKGVLPPKTWEIVLPGVHSDLGCGYAPMEQGKGTDESGADMIARIPLVVMYRMARLYGVPLKLEFASEVAQARFKILPSTIGALNNYTAACRVKTGSLTAIMRDQARMQMEWRLSRRSSGPTPIQTTEFYKRCNMLDKNDFYSANLEFEREIGFFEEWRKEEGDDFKPEKQDPGFDNDREDEWEEIATWYRAHPKPPAAVMIMFDDYVHDSRAWFKLIPGNPSSEKEVHEQLQKWVKKRDHYNRLHAETIKLKAANNGVDPRKPRLNPMWSPPEEKYALDPAQLKAANEYSAKDGKAIPHMITTGREPYEYMNRAGYLRYRKIYGGWDDVLLSTAPARATKGDNTTSQAA